MLTKQVKRFIDTLSKISETWLLKSIQKGLMYNMPIILVGSIAVLLINIPIQPFQQLMNAIFKDYWTEVLFFVYNSSLQVLSISVLIGVTYAILLGNKYVNNESISYPVVLTIVLGSYIAFIKTDDVLIPLHMASSTGLFMSMLYAVISTTLFIFLYKHRVFKVKFTEYNTDNTLNKTLDSVEPAVTTLLIISIVKILINYFGFNEINWDFFSAFLLKINNLLGVAIFQTVAGFLWFMGLHGNNILENVTDDVFLSQSITNMNLVTQGLPPTQMFTKQFLDIFVYLGGTGTTLSLILALFIKGRKSSSYRLARLSVLPGVFNINELIVFALPIVLNPFFLIPFVIAPIILAISTYIAMAIGFVPLTMNSTINWTTPIILGGYMATGSINGSILQIFNLFLGTLIYYPFVSIYEKHKIDMNKKVFGNLCQLILDNNFEEVRSLLKRKDDIGALARSLAQDIINALDEEQCPLYMVYQPQVNYEGSVTGFEALLRWKHETYGFIPPPVIIFVAEKSGLADRLGNWIFEQSISGFADMNEELNKEISISINLTSIQVKNADLYDFVVRLLKKYNVSPKRVEFELTETDAFSLNDKTIKILFNLKKLGCRISMDDFGTGYSSLMYIKDFNIDKIKLDKVLVKDIINDINSQRIVSTISDLCATLNLDLIAEFVETEEQTEKLNSLGCSLYQGYYYSQPLYKEDAIQFVKDTK